MIGLVSSAHCIGMCGGFAAAIGATDQPLGPALIRQIFYSAGRIFTYAFLGACGGHAGGYLTQLGSALFGVQRMFSMIAGGTMLLVGASVLGWLPLPGRRAGGLATLAAPIFSRLLSARGWSGFFLAGLANGFLPCGLVYALLAMAVATADMVDGMLLMTFFGIGTVPAMLIVGCGSTLVSHAIRAKIYRIAACFVILAGLFTIKRALMTPSQDCCPPSDVVITDEASSAYPIDPRGTGFQQVKHKPLGHRFSTGETHESQTHAALLGIGLWSLGRIPRDPWRCAV